MKLPTDPESLVKLFGMGNQMLENDLAAIAAKHSINLGRGVYHSGDADEVYYPQFDALVRAEAAGMAAHYEIFYCLEKTIRSFISDSLQAIEGPSWWDSARVSATLKTNVEDRIKKELDSGVTPRSDNRMKIRAGGRTNEIPDAMLRVGAKNVVIGAVPKPGKWTTTTAATAPTKFDSKWEERYAKVLAMEQATGTIERFWYHPFSMWLPGKVRYTPDFLIQYPGHLQIVEIKGWSKNLRDGMTRLKIAASIFPCYTWYVAKWTGKEFEFIPVEVDPW